MKRKHTRKGGEILKNPTNTAVLAAAMSDTGYDIKKLAKAMHTPAALLKCKVNGWLEFNTNDMDKIKALLDLTPEMALKIFFDY